MEWYKWVLILVFAVPAGLVVLAYMGLLSYWWRQEREKKVWIPK